jgi:hypothetical protein
MVVVTMFDVLWMMMMGREGEKEKSSNSRI